MTDSGELSEREAVLQLLRGRLERCIGAELPLDGDSDLFELGLDSVDAVEVSGEMETALGLEIDPELLFECRTINRASDRLMMLLGRRDA